MHAVKRMYLDELVLLARIAAGMAERSSSQFEEASGHPGAIACCRPCQPVPLPTTWYHDLGPFASTRNLLRPAFSLVAAEMAWRCNTYLRMPTWDDIDAVLVAGGCSCCQCPV